MRFFEKLFDKSKGAYYTATNQTVEAEITQSSSGRKTRGAFFVARQLQKTVDGRPWGGSGQESYGSEYGAVETERSQSSHTGGNVHENITRIK